MTRIEVDSECFPGGQMVDLFLKNVFGQPLLYSPGNVCPAGQTSACNTVISGTTTVGCCPLYVPACPNSVETRCKADMC